MRRALLAVAAVTAAHSAPALTFVPAVRRHLPRLNGDVAADRIALTFDDGPDAASTPQLLDLLDQLEVRATFFLLGEMVERHPDVARRLVADGHELGLHGWHHRNSLRVSPFALRRSLVRALRQIEDVTGRRPTLYRPPYGVVTLGTLWAARSLGLRTVLWGAWGRDWEATATGASVLRTLAPDLVGGATVLLHDSDCTSAPGSWRSTLDAVPDLVTELRGRGLQVGTIGAGEAGPGQAPVLVG